jgi:hypothetical protein
VTDEGSHYVERFFDELRRIVVDRQQQEWRDYAACRGIGPERFFAARGDHDAVEAAKRLCESCPVRVECFDYAATVRTRYGIWGGYGATRVKRLSPSYPRERIACPECGVDYEPDSAGQTYCSTACHEARRRRHRRTEVSDGVEFAL